MKNLLITLLFASLFVVLVNYGVWGLSIIAGLFGGGMVFLALEVSDLREEMKNLRS